MKVFSKNNLKIFKGLSKKIRNRAMKLIKVLGKEKDATDRNVIKRAVKKARRWANYKGIGKMVLPASENDQYVVPFEGKWGIQPENASTPVLVFDTKREAVVKGMEIAKETGSHLIIMRDDGTIQDDLSYEDKKEKKNEEVVL